MTGRAGEWIDAPLDPMLVEASQTLAATYVSDVFPVGRWRWHIRRLDDEGEAWAANATGSNANVYASGTGLRVTTLAAAILGIGPYDPDAPADAPHPPIRTVAELYPVPAGAPPTQVQALADPVRLTHWQRGQLLKWLRSPAVPPDVRDELHNAYMSLVIKQRRLLEALGPLSIDPLTGASGRSFLPAKGS